MTAPVTAQRIQFDHAGSVGVSASGYYVRNAQSPRLTELAEMLRNWPQRDS